MVGGVWRLCLEGFNYKFRRAFAPRDNFELQLRSRQNQWESKVPHTPLSPLSHPCHLDWPSQLTRRLGAFGSGKIERKLYLSPRDGGRGRGRVRCLQVRQRFWLFMLVLSCSFCLALALTPSHCASAAAFKTLSSAELLRLGLRCCCRCAAL